MAERRVLNKDEQNIRTGLQELGEMVQSAIENVCHALATLDTTLCEAIVANDKSINAQQYKIEQECLTTIATQQPVATDLRVLVAAMFISVELERIADHVSGIAKTTIKLASETPVTNVEAVLAMANACKEMLQQAVQAYLAYDAEQAFTIAAKDREIDDLQTRISTDIINQMCENAQRVPFGSGLLWIVHALERIGDRATNICEQIVYIKKSEILDLNS